MSAGWLREGVHRRWKSLRGTGNGSAAPFPWFVQHSWADYRLLQLHSPAWRSLRDCAATCDRGLDVIRTVLAADPARLLEQYQEDLGPQFNYFLVQAALHFDGPRPDVAAPDAPASLVSLALGSNSS